MVILKNLVILDKISVPDNSWMSTSNQFEIAVGSDSVNCSDAHGFNGCQNQSGLFGMVNVRDVWEI